MPEIIVKLGDNVVQKYFFVKETMSVGRAADNEIVIENLAISRNHAVIKCEDGKYMLIDLGSSNGTYVNGVKVKRTELLDRDVITLGKHKLFFYDQRAVEAPRKVALPEGDCTMLVAPTTVGLLNVIKGRQKGQTFTLDRPVVTLGKGNDCDIQLNDWFVSKQHAVIERQGEEFHIRDLNSWRHTRVNGEIVEHAPLLSGDSIQLGPTVALTFQLESSFRELSSATALSRREELNSAGAPLAAPQDFAAADAAAEAQAKGTSGVDEEWMRQFPQAAENGGFGLAVGREPSPLDEPMADEALGAEEMPTAEVAPEVPVAVLEDMAAYSVAAAAEATGEGLAIKSAAVIKEPDPIEPAVGASPEEDVVEPALEIDDANQIAESEESASSAAASPIDEPADVPDPALAQEISLWERALQNPSAVIRKQAARRLKQLTGKDYDY